MASFEIGRLRMLPVQLHAYHADAVRRQEMLFYPSARVNDDFSQLKAILQFFVVLSGAALSLDKSRISAFKQL